jgi:hypothetical protein
VDQSFAGKLLHLLIILRCISCAVYPLDGTIVCRNFAFAYGVPPVSHVGVIYQQQPNDSLSHRLRTTTREALCIPWESPNVSQRGDGVVGGTYESEMWLK